ncbi:hypothetical protein [Haloarcula amylolytica]|uniref:hypothetical protein n=1 Tax=Haloarcula amylolytica TaxID=396317 RepID=UPI001267031B|nr:hypothetical protein [Haloarcula amylolytica]
MESPQGESFFFGLFTLFFVAPVISSTLPFNEGVAVSALLSGFIGILLIFFSLSFGNDSDLSQELASIRYDPTGESALQTGISEARETIDAQIETLNDIDTKAIRVLRVNVLLVGLFISALTFSTRTNSLNLDAFINIYLGNGILLLILSTVSAGLTYTASNFKPGIGKQNIITTLEEDLNKEELDRVLIKSYAKWINDNNSTQTLNAFYSTSMLLFLIYALTYLALGTYSALIDDVPLFLNIIAMLALFAITLASGYLSQIKEVGRQLERDIG